VGASTAVLDAGVARGGASGSDVVAGVVGRTSGALARSARSLRRGVDEGATSSIGARSVGAPSVGALSIDAPSVDAPSVDAPSVGAPSVDALSVGAPSVGERSVARSSVALDAGS
jgi:hypothetical protein